MPRPLAVLALPILVADAFVLPSPPQLHSARRSHTLSMVTEELNVAELGKKLFDGASKSLSGVLGGDDKKKGSDPMATPAPPDAFDPSKLFDSAAKAFDGASKAVGGMVGGMVGSGADENKAGAEASAEEDDGKMTIEKVAAFGIAGILSIAVAETVFWVLSFPISELLYFISTGEWIDLMTQDGQIKFLAFTAGWGAIGGVIAQYRTVLTAAAITPWMDRTVVKPYVQPALDKLDIKLPFGGDQADQPADQPADGQAAEPAQAVDEATAAPRELD